MSHLSLYRKYRPQTFDDVVGQQHITRTLRNAVREGRVAHAYLFTGPRGTGKTTTARILAKALNCAQGPTPEPDDTCEQCRDIAEGRHPDVHELDAASRTQVENVREEIIGRLAYAPTRGTWKVYIIDEVHMLSTHSFNALLKTLEEPPAHTVFVLCTTHPNKIPETIHSRCQRFDFHRIGVDDIVAKLSLIAKAESVSVDDSALVLVARHAGGGMRDALTTFEQVVSFTGPKVDIEDVAGLLGEVDRQLLFDLSGLIARRDVGGSFRFVAQLAETGVDFSEFVRELLGHYRDLYVAALIGEPAGVVDATGDEAVRLASQAREYGADRLARALDVLGEVSAGLRWSSDPRLALEVALTRLARPAGEVTLASLAERLDALERGALALPEPLVSPPPESASPSRPDKAPPAARPEVPEPAAPGEPVVAEAPPYAVSASAPSQTTALDRSRVKRLWPAVVAEIKKVRQSRASLFAGVEVDLDEDGTLRIEFPAEQEASRDIAEQPATLELLRQALTVVVGAVPPFRFQVGRGVAAPTESANWHADADGSRGSVIDELGAEVISETPAGSATHVAAGEESA